MHTDYRCPSFMGEKSLWGELSSVPKEPVSDPKKVDTLSKTNQMGLCRFSIPTPFPATLSPLNTSFIMPQCSSSLPLSTTSILTKESSFISTEEVEIDFLNLSPVFQEEEKELAKTTTALLLHKGAPEAKNMEGAEKKSRRRTQPPSSEKEKTEMAKIMNRQYSKISHARRKAILETHASELKKFDEMLKEINQIVKNQADLLPCLTTGDTSSPPPLPRKIKSPSSIRRNKQRKRIEDVVTKAIATALYYQERDRQAREQLANLTELISKMSQ